VVVVPRSGVYVVHDTRCSYDFFRYGVYWFIWNDGYWYPRALVPRAVHRDRGALRADRDLERAGPSLAAPSARRASGSGADEYRHHHDR
jgi:hypothetical protein